MNTTRLAIPDPTAVVRNAESTLALRDKNYEPIYLWATPRYEDTNEYSTRSMLLLAMNALAYISVADPIREAYAAGVYRTKDEQGEHFTILLSGSGPIPTTTRQNVTRVVSLLRAAAESDTLVPDLFAELTLGGFDKWRRRAYLDDEAAWNRRIEGVREELVDDELAMFDAIIERIDAIKDYVATHRNLQAVDDARSSARSKLLTAVAALDAMLQQEPVRTLLIRKVDGMLSELVGLREHLTFGHPVLDDRSNVEDSGRRLREDFSVSHFALNILGYYRCTAYLSLLVKRLPAYFSGDWPKIVFCPSTKRTVPIDTVLARRTLAAEVKSLRTLRTRPERFVTGFPHAAPNLLEHLLLAISTTPRAVLIPVIGTSSLVCAGCDTYLHAYGNSHYARINSGLVTWPKIKFEYPGTTGLFRYPWLSPNLRKSHKALHEYLQKRTNDILTEVLANIYETREMAQAYLERRKKQEEDEEARTTVIT